MIESKPSDVIFDDFRIHSPFPALLVKIKCLNIIQDYALSINFENLEDNVHSHIPYPIILIRALH